MRRVMLIFLLAVIACIMFFNVEDPLLTEIKRRYNILLNSDLPPECKVLSKNKAIITSKTRSESDQNIAFNVNKGYEIHICLDGRKINGAMYVFLHELAHITVEEYDHSEAFWSHFKILRLHAASLGIYTPENDTEYCGQTIHDPLASGSL